MPRTISYNPKNSDTGATDMPDRLVYATSTGVGGLAGNFGGDPAKTRHNPDRQAVRR